jgi:hypothetical protein
MPAKHAASADAKSILPLATAVPAKIDAASSLTKVAKKKNAKSPAADASATPGSI